ncbi:MAG: TrmH family RNA methyltransferase [Acidimicrobiales bacterium]
MAVEPLVIGAKNPRLRRLKQLNNRTKVRSEERAFVVDGPVLVADALRSGLVVEQVFAGPDVLFENNLQSLIGPQTEVFEVEPSVLVAALDPVNPRPLAAVVAQPRWGFDGLAADRPILVAVELRDPGNMGTMLRTAEAAGFGGVVIIGDSVDCMAPKVVRASAGSVLRIPFVRVGDAAEAMGSIRAGGWPILAAVVDPEAPTYDGFDLRTAAIVVGNEPHGLSAETIKLGDGQFTIPLSETVESLNVAAAASVLCFEAARQRRVTAS